MFRLTSIFALKAFSAFSEPEMPVPAEAPEHVIQVQQTQDDGMKGGNLIDDSLAVYPPHIKELYQNIARQTKYQPCEILAEAQELLAGLQEGRLAYLGMNEENRFVELSDLEDGSIHSLHGPHVSALIQYYGPNQIMDLEAFKQGEPYSGILYEALGENRDAYIGVIYNLGSASRADDMQEIDPDITDKVPGEPNIGQCFLSSLSSLDLTRA